MEFKVPMIYNHKDSVSQGTTFFISTQSPVHARQRRSLKTCLVTYTTYLLRMIVVRSDKAYGLLGVRKNRNGLCHMAGASNSKRCWCRNDQKSENSLYTPNTIPLQSRYRGFHEGTNFSAPKRFPPRLNT